MASESIASQEHLPRVFILGAFPPPVHGASAINVAVFDYLSLSGLTVERVDTVAAVFGSATKRERFRPLRVLIELGKLGSARIRRGSFDCYISVAGGYAQGYDVLFALIARLSGARLVVHHHSFRYIAQKWWLTNLLQRVLGPSCTHVFLCEGMAQGFRRHYGRNHQSLVVSNQAFLKFDGRPNDRAECRRVGYISNITREKGIESVVDVAQRLRDMGSALEIVIAGGIVDPELKSWFDSKIACLPNVRYVGAVYGEEKERFLRDVDVILFPTRYRNEAEPLVLLEALQRGLPSIANNRGCISGLLADGGGIGISDPVEFVSTAVQTLLTWQNDSRVFRAAAAAARKKWISGQDKSVAAKAAFLEAFKSKHYA